MLSVLNTDTCIQPRGHMHAHRNTLQRDPRKLLEVMNIFISLIVVKVT